MNKFIFSFCLLLATISATHAYSILDQGQIVIDLPTPWKATNTQNTAGQAATIYAKENANGKPEGLAEISIQKKKNKTALAQIQEMNFRIESQLGAAGCKSSGLIQLPQKNNMFSAWIETFQCSYSALSLVQLFIDADARNIYLLTYTNTEYPFTKTTEKAAFQFLKSAAKICYADKKCYSVQ